MVYVKESLRKIHNNLPDPSSGDVFAKADNKADNIYPFKEEH